MSKKIENSIKGIIFIAIFIVLFCSIGVLLNPNGTYEEWFQSYSVIEFYKKKEDTVDIIYVGNSCIYTGVSPLEIYDRIGVTGYPLSTPRQKLWASYYWMKEALKYQKPKAFFVEVGEAFATKKNNDELAIRRAIDSMKFGKNKLEMIMDSDFELSNFDKLSCIFPILRYHSRATKLKETDFRKLVVREDYTFCGFFVNKVTKGYKGKFDKKAKQKYLELMEKTKVENTTEISKESEEKMKQMVELCKNNHCELVLIKIPEPRDWTPQKNQAIAEFAANNHIKFIDLNYDENININWETDTQDEGDHLNIKGAEKIGEYLSNYIKQNFTIEDHRNDENYGEWNEMLRRYKEDKSITK